MVSKKRQESDFRPEFPQLAGWSNSVSRFKKQKSSYLEGHLGFRWNQQTALLFNLGRRIADFQITEVDHKLRCLACYKATGQRRLLMRVANAEVPGTREACPFRVSALKR